MEPKNRVWITEAKFKDGHDVQVPNMPDTDASPVHHRVWVGNELDGWVEVPYVTNVDIPLRQGELRKVTITVLMPQIDFEGKR